GPPLRWREQSQDVRLLTWIESLRADAIFGWRQLRKKKATSAAAILSLALAIGACTAAFRIIDALLLRPLPVAEPHQLYDVFRHEIFFDGTPQTFDGWAYPAFRRMRAAVRGQAELIAISYAERTDLTYGSDQEMEKAQLQYVSGWMFHSFGLRAAWGRLFDENDDREPGARPYAVLSYDYWSRRFARDPKVLGRTFRVGNSLYEVVGVAPEPFTGTEPGTVVDLFVPTMMNPAVVRDDSTWFRTLLRLKPDVSAEVVRQKLNAVSLEFERERSKGFTGMPQQSIDNWLKQKVLLAPAAAGVSGMQEDYRKSLAVLAVLVALVLMIACANVANLMVAQAAARAREMALRVSIGAGRWRLVQMALVEAGEVAFLAAMLGGLLARWSAPFVVSRINPPDNPARLVLPADWRVAAFGMALSLAVTFLLGLAPALRASSVKPASALKGGEDPHSRRRLMRVLIAGQVAFCFLVLFVAGLLVSTFQRLSTQPTGFSAERLLVLDTVAGHPQLPVFWDQVLEHLRGAPGVESAALASQPLLGGYSSNDTISVNGAPPGQVLAYFLSVSPGWFETMKIPFAGGQDFRTGDTNPGAAVVSETFAREFFNGGNPVGRSFDEVTDEAQRRHFRVVGVVRDARYRDVRGPFLPVAYLPFRAVRGDRSPQAAGQGTFLVRTARSNPLSLAPYLRLEVERSGREFRVSNIRTQVEINQSQTIRERLLAMLALFFAMVALLLAGVGLYGVLDYSVLERRREIGIRMAIGAPAAEIAMRVTLEALAMVTAGALSGIALGMGSVRYIQGLLYQVKVTDLTMLAVPGLTLLAVALLAAVSPVIRAVRIDPVRTLRSE
ncbi:MAG TPA: ABC transporter permease, partial [Bryobacteraceae bacterium]|nr:ABC transporter permease [Bryobacteraceae bacterium]